ncbi:hypothetical protein [Microbacterium xanthum]|uniref:hypothetical protein n=1 Tax=Microbacterium xanthum TaxID=3079794 RepID=UPI002AD1FB9A|nr:hypothetical protein [Microbacterium sp. KSW-48]MDZ8172694.1 hypothetical protein [Microbacterium sp. KSW-48]
MFPLAHPETRLAGIGALIGALLGLVSLAMFLGVGVVDGLGILAPLCGVAGSTLVVLSASTITKRTREIRNR